VSCNGDTSDFESAAFAELVEAVPGLPIVVEHLAGSGVPMDDPWQGGVLRRAFAIGRFPNVFLKFHGLGEFCRRVLTSVGSAISFIQPVPPILEEAVRCFGPSRLMWGSDFPPVSGREGYGNALKLPMRLLETYARDDLNAMFGDTARAVFFTRS
jgi:L-fuconolactonase